MAKIDVLLPVKNGLDFLAESLDSVRAQSIQDWRLLVLDHGSTDGSRELAEQYHARDPRIVVHSCPDARGLSGLLNRGIELADCDYLMRHDADDVCFPDRMALSLAAFAAAPGTVAVSGSAELINGAGLTTGASRLPVGQTRLAAAALFHNPVVHPAAMLDFAAMRRMGVRYGVDFVQALPPEQRIEVPSLAEDYFLFGQLAIQGKCANVPQQLIRYRWHGNNVSVTKFKDQMALSLSLSRYLARSLCAMHGQPDFDPAPFCNHGGQLFDIDGRSDFEAEYQAMAAVLRRIWGSTPGLEHELAYRHVLATRQVPALLWRYWRFQRDHTPETGQWNAVRQWLLRALPGRASLRVPIEGLA